MSTKETSQSIWPFIRSLISPHKKKMLIGIFALIIVNLLLLTTPLILSRIIDTYNMYNSQGYVDINKVILLAALLLGISLLIFGLRIAWRSLLILPSYKITKNTKDSMYSHILSLSQDSLKQYSVGEQISLLSREAKQLSDAISWGTLALADGILSIIFVYVVLIVSYREMVWASLLVYPFTVVFVYFIFNNIGKAYTIIQEHIASISELTREMLQHIATIKSFNSESYYINRFFKKGNEIIKARIRITALEGLLMPVFTVIHSASIILALYLSIGQIKAGHASIGDLSAVLNYLFQVAMPFMGLSFALDIQQKGISNAKRIRALLETQTTLTPNNTCPHNSHPIKNCRIDIDNIMLTYPSPAPQPPLANSDIESPPPMNEVKIRNTAFTLGPISLQIEGGQWLGITGKIGCGKSTLAQLLARIYDTDHGTIMYDNIPIQNMDLNTLRAHVLLQTQQFQLFSWTVAQNIMFTEDELSQEQYKTIIDYGIMSGLKEDVALFPEKWNTQIGESGILLSGGQKQRVALSRSLIINTPILVLDDIFSGIDYKNASEIISNLRTLRKDRTTIIISHNLAILSNTDTIIVMDNGKITEQGTHTSLLNAPNSLYAASWHEYLISQGQQLE